MSDTSRTASWTAGPFAAPNVTGTSGTVTCAPGLCDDFALHVSTPAGYGDTHQLTVKVAWPVAAADFDVYLLDSAGNEVASAASSSDPEVVVIAPTSGDYTVRVVPFAPLGQSITGTATLTDIPANPAPSTATPDPLAVWRSRDVPAGARRRRAVDRLQPQDQRRVLPGSLRHLQGHVGRLGEPVQGHLERRVRQGRQRVRHR